jgi:hypothetical protein
MISYHMANSIGRWAAVVYYVGGGNECGVQMPRSRSVEVGSDSGADELEITLKVIEGPWIEYSY